ncbi:hypothetical protein F5B19DRAFT_224798 [Rostrohypoxylon terebratum]|nr:hypothetical protein F5B19DRAFT_224798 [Rostrohypoxylon terebratum]
MVCPAASNLPRSILALLYINLHFYYFLFLLLPVHPFPVPHLAVTSTTSPTSTTPLFFTSHLHFLLLLSHRLHHLFKYTARYPIFCMFCLFSFFSLFFLQPSPFPYLTSPARCNKPRAYSPALSSVIILLYFSTPTLSYQL